MSLLFRVSLITEYTGQEALMTRYYFAETGTAQELAEIWEANILPGMKALMSAIVNMKLLQVDEVLASMDSYTIDLSGNQGGGVTDPLPKFDAVGLAFPVTTPVTRRGSNRIMGVTEGQTIDGELEPTWVQAWGALAIAMAVGIAVGPNTYFPSVVRDLALRWLINAISSGIVTGITTQNSRKNRTQGSVNIPSRAPDKQAVIIFVQPDPIDITASFTLVGPVPPTEGPQALFPRLEDKVPPVIINDI